MTKQEIVDIVSNATGLTKVETETIMNGVMTTIIDSLANNEKVELRGFGTFGIKHRMPKKARNPGTGEPVFLPERFVPTFKPSKLMRSRVNELIKKKYTIVSVEQTSKSNSLENVKLPEMPLALVFGNEVNGVSQEVINLCEESIEIPQLGTKRSLNVSVAVGIVIWKYYELIKN